MDSGAFSKPKDYSKSKEDLRTGEETYALEELNI